MDPSGDCNLADYYHRAKGNADMLSLLRSFPGCLASALQHLHASGVIHRDIKPQNIVVKGDTPLITDFGIVYHWGNLIRSTKSGADSGKTSVYTAPEVINQETQSEASDIWSLRCVFLEIATVLKGGEIRDMWEGLHEGSDGYRSRARQDRWVSQLRDIPPECDLVVLEWATAMLYNVPSERLTAAQLFEDIVVKSTRLGVHFCGTCCQDETGATTEDDGDLWCGHESDGT